MEDGSKKAAKAASIYDVAGEPGVSVFTVSAVINNKSYVGKGLRKRVEAAIRKLNYRPNLIARGLAKLRTHTIGMIVPDIANPFFPMVVRGAEDAAQKHGYNLPLCNSDDSLDKEKAVELLLSKRVDDILLTKAAEDFRSPVRQMIEEVNIPFVLVMRTYPKLTRDAVISDDYQGAYDAVCHLAQAGRRRIGLISGPLKISNAKAHWQGSHDALKAKALRSGIGHRRGLPHRIRISCRSQSSLASPGRNLCGQPFDDDWIAKGSRGNWLEVPEDFGLVSFDDYPWLSIFRPRLTTVELQAPTRE